MTKRIAIIGGGIAGVTAAYELASSRADVEATLYEASPRLGGIVETVREGGFIIECGPDGWVTEKPWAAALARQLGLEDELLPSNDATRKTYILQNGKLEAMPDGMKMMVSANIEALEASALFSEAAKQAYRDEPARAAELKASAPTEDESVASFVRRHFGDEVLRTVGAPLLSGVFGGDVETLSVRAVMAPFVAMEREHGSLITALQSRTSTQSAAIFTTLRSGTATLIERMVAAIPPHWIRLGTSVIAIDRDASGWNVRTTGRGAESFDEIFLATPVDAARTLLEPIDRVLAALMEMDASSAVVVAFGFTDRFGIDLPPGFGFLAPAGLGSRLLACTFVDQKFDHRIPAEGRLIRAFFGGATAERIANCGNDEAAAIARLELARIIGPLPDAQVTVVRRWPRSLPQYAVGHLERMAELDQRIKTFPGLTLLGNGYRGVGLPDLIRDATAAAQKAVIGLC
jgi:protoporphyrinogen/coproporphyrinogen III oxidase